MPPRRFNKKDQEVDTSPIALAFREYANELDSKHDRHERIVKLSRDITIESKRIIFLLHSIDSRKNREKIINEAEQRLNKLIENNFKAVANELMGQDVYQFRSAYSPGLQEFIEAYTFAEYLKSESQDNDGTNGVVSDWNAIQANMQYEKQVESSNSKNADADVEAVIEEQPLQTQPKKFQFFVDPTEYILGLSDLTGELMRRCINSLGSGETETCLATCKVLQQFYTGYIGINGARVRELSRKITTMRQSVLKAENVCYNVKVRGGEAAKWGATFDQKTVEEVDEGFY